MTREERHEKLMDMYWHDLIDLVLAQIVKDLENGDSTAIVEMLSKLPKELLIAFLPEEQEV